MSVRIKIVDRYNRPVSGVTVSVLWHGASSREKTNSNGMADLGCSGGNAKSVQVDGKVVDEDCHLRDGLITYQHPSR